MIRWKTLAAGEIDSDTFQDRVLDNGVLLEAVGDNWTIAGGEHYIIPANAFDEFAGDLKILLGWLLTIREKGEQLGNLNMSDIDKVQEDALKIGIHAMPFGGN